MSKTVVVHRKAWKKILSKSCLCQLATLLMLETRGCSLKWPIQGGSARKGVPFSGLRYMKKMIKNGLYNWKGWRVGPRGGASPYKTLLSSLPPPGAGTDCWQSVAKWVVGDSKHVHTQIRFLTLTMKRKSITNRFGPRRRQEDKK